MPTKKEVKIIAPRKKRGKYDNKIEVKAGTTFMDIINVSVKDAKVNDKKQNNG